MTTLSSRATRIWVALSGAAGVAMLIAHFQIPAHVPGDNSPPATITQYILHHHAAILASAWLQGFGPFPYVLFALGVVYLAGATTRPAGWVTLLASAVILTLSLIDAAFTISAAQAVTHGHPGTAAVSFDLVDGPGNDAVGRVFLIAPPLLPLGAALLGSRLLPRAFGYTAVAFGVASIIMGLAALFSATAFSLAIILIIAESTWVLAAAGALVIAPKPASGPPVPSQPPPQATGSRTSVPRRSEGTRDASPGEIVPLGAAAFWTAPTARTSSLYSRNSVFRRPAYCSTAMGSTL